MIADSCKKLFIAKKIAIEVDRIDFCSSHVYYQDDEVRQLVEPYHNLFALVLLRKQVQGSYEHQQEIRIAHLQTRLNIIETGSTEVVGIEFYDVGRYLKPIISEAYQATEAIYQNLLINGSSFTNERSKTVVLAIGLRPNQSAIIIEMSTETELYNVKLFDQ